MKTLSGKVRRYLLCSCLFLAVLVSGFSLWLLHEVQRPDPNPYGYYLVRTNQRVINQFIRDNPGYPVASYSSTDAEVSTDGRYYSGGEIIFWNPDRKLFYAARFRVPQLAPSLSEALPKPSWDIANASFECYASTTNILGVRDPRNFWQASRSLRDVQLESAQTKQDGT